jgi:hypothetical protein
MRGLAILACLVSSLAVVAAGCGGGGSSGGGEPLTKEQYQAKVKAIARQIGSELGSAVNLGKQTSPADVDKGVKALHEFANELADVTPPKEVAQAHQLLIDGMNTLADELKPLVEKLNKTKDPTEALSALFSLKALQLLNKAQQEFKQAGYTVNLDTGLNAGTTTTGP